MKLATNSTRDRANTAALESRGWTILRFWEHEDSIDAARVVLDVVRTRFS
jgi:DNA mismatch endonuclease (patch repair protein)